MTISPLAQFQPQIALLSGAFNDASIEILLRAFIFEGVLEYPSIRLDHIALPSLALVELVGRQYEFPINPEHGYIDGSMYFASSHHPVDVTTLSFHRARDGGASVVLKGVIDFELQGDRVGEGCHLHSVFELVHVRSNNTLNTDRQQASAC